MFQSKSGSVSSFKFGVLPIIVCSKGVTVDIFIQSSDPVSTVSGYYSRVPAPSKSISYKKKPKTRPELDRRIFLWVGGQASPSLIATCAPRHICACFHTFPRSKSGA